MLLSYSICFCTIKDKKRGWTLNSAGYLLGPCDHGYGRGGNLQQGAGIDARRCLPPSTLQLPLWHLRPQLPPSLLRCSDQETRSGAFR
uniref:Galanin domain-containing protein n=1 Tax=Esox lucius TaxID=8010 RepID=A0A6Q2Y0E4_ESOLU